MATPSYNEATVSEIFSPGGALTCALPGYEFREGQLHMAQAVERALRNERVLLCEAGTGTGKTLAYLIPAILCGKKVVVSTATRALQEQILHHDLPLIEQALGFAINAALMKGLGNYLCLRRYELTRAAPGGDGHSLRKLSLIEDWATRTLEGDISELHELQEADPMLARVVSSSDTRVGPSCAHYAECFVTKMKQRAAAASLVVVNHHLFFADLALRGPHPGQVLPDYDVVIFDEAHHLEDIATNFFSLKVSSGGFDVLCRDAEAALSRLQGSSPLAVVNTLRRAADDFFEHLRRSHPTTEGRTAVQNGTWSGGGARLWHDLDTALEAVLATCEVARGRDELQGSAALANEIDVLGRRADKIRHQLASIVEADSAFVAWVEMNARSVQLSASPVNLAPVLRSQLFDVVPTVILTSATLADAPASNAPLGEGTGSGQALYGFLRQRLGLDESMSQPEELVVPAPFDFARRSLLYVPNDLPPPSEQQFTSQAGQRAAELIAITDGGAFVLTTSTRAMRELHAELSAQRGDRLVLLQGEAPKHVLLQRFRDDGRAVLVATMSFWEGVDVPGRALRLVIMDKLPFAVPTDPILRARATALEQAGQSGFRDLYLPLAQRTLKQGFGRLLRHRDDAGIVAVLDPRLRQRGYGKKLLAALPPSPQVETLQAVREFWRRFEEPSSTAELATGGSADLAAG